MYDWDERKRRLNLLKHGVDFAEVDGFEWEMATIRPDLRRDYGEDRYIAFGSIGGRLHTLIFTPRGGQVRIVSLRKANPREERSYEKTKKT